MPTDADPAFPPLVLTFAASDPSSGAGIQADLLTLSSMGCHPLSVITALTVQDTIGVEAMRAVDAEMNIIRARQFSPAKPLALGMSQAAARTAIFNERWFELTGEGKRRSDMIRAGTFLDARRFKGVTAGYKVLFPIPQTQIASNPQLTQNPGY